VVKSLGEGMMRAFVLSGGGNRGPLEVGALQVLLERGIVPDMLVGTSAGAINAAFLAIDPSPDTARDLGHIWLKANEEGVFRRHRLTMLWRFMSGKDSLQSNEGFRRHVERSLPPEMQRFADIQAARLFIVATRLDTGEARVFGHDPQERLLDAIMASTALPPFFPPWACGDELLIDGGISADLPVSIAVAEGAREIYALHLVDAPQGGRQMRGLLSIAEQAINTVLSRQLQMELRESENIKGVTLHYVPLTGYYGFPLWDLSHAQEMIDEGRRQMEEYLQAPRGVATSERLSWPRAALRGALQRLRRGWSRTPGKRRIPRHHAGPLSGPVGSRS
jgi:NTE family protein